MYTDLNKKRGDRKRRKGEKSYAYKSIKLKKRTKNLKVIMSEFR